MTPADEELRLAIVVLRADYAAALAAIEAVSRAVKLSLIDGLPLLKWVERQRVVELEKILIALEDSDPALAAALQARVDQARKNLKNDSEA